ncbi:hypothetical protein [Schnuerera sp.]|uniref:hypothetical protein n=1 Tax=Schnuerera sp. TaxID=2794844 RepID=UPI002D809861|nr:hypothetical protein [Schnuerera sp.]
MRCYMSTLTEQEQAKLQLKQQLFFKKIKNDKRWYIENFLYIRDKHSQLIPLELNSAQQIFDEKITECEREGKLKRFIVLKARQMGLSTYTEARIFANTSTNKFVNSLIIAHEDKATQHLFNMSKLFYEELPDAIRPMKKYSNEKALVFENPTNDEIEKKKNPGLRSRITVATAGTAETGRSPTIHNLHISELAFFPDPERSMTALLQSVPDTPESLIVIESTANGVGDYFHRMWMQAVRGENDFIPIFLPWFTDPTYSKPFTTDGERQQFIDEVNMVSEDANGNIIHTDEYLLKEKFGLTYEQLNWRKYTIANKCNGDLDIFHQEYPSTPEEAFIASGRPKFSTTALKKYEKLVKPGVRGYLVEHGRSVKFVEDPKGYVEIWDYPKKGEFYSVGADVAEGLAHGDYSCGLVGDSKFNIVAMWHGHIDPDLFGDELYKLGVFYNYAYLGIENNNHGLTTLKRLQDREYWNIYFQKTYDRITDQITSKMGWNTNVKTKPLMIDKLAEFIRELYLGIYSDLVISECFTYVINDNGTTDAQQGCHDDTVMALGILLQLLLEGKGENYAPEVPDERCGRRRIRNAPEIIDPLFEGEDITHEIAE